MTRSHETAGARRLGLARLARAVQPGMRRAAIATAAVASATIGLTIVAPGVALASTLTVTNCNSSGTGSLPSAVANAAAGDIITFDPSSLKITNNTGGVHILSGNKTSGSVTIKNNS